MKKVLLFSLATTVALSAFAQKSKSHISSKSINAGHRVAAKTTATGDTVLLEHINLANDTLTAYYATSSTDSGFITGTNAFGDQGFAERYDANDTLFSVIGVLAEFTGTVNPASTKTVVFNAWSVGPQTLWSAAPSGHVYNSGFPATSLASKTVPVTSLGISTVAGASDTIKAFYFATPTTDLHKFFVGYTIAYNPTALAGDTIALLNSKDGERHISFATVSGADTIINNINATQFNDNSWHDNAFDNFRIGNHLLIFPIVKLGVPNSVEGVTKNNLTFFGNYPNPATNATNIKFSVAKATEVTISVTDMSGKVVKTINDKYNAGTQIVELNTTSLPAGEYIYLIRTAEGDGMASKMSIIK